MMAGRERRSHSWKEQEGDAGGDVKIHLLG